VVLASLSLLVAVLGVYTSSALFDSGNFADRATSSFEEPEVQRVVGERVSDEVTKAAPNAVAGKPLIEAVVEGVAGTPAFQSLARAGVKDLHRTIFGADKDTV